MYIKAARTQWVKNNVKKLLSMGLPLLHIGTLYCMQKTLIEQSFKVAQECPFCLCYTMVLYVQHCPVGSRDRFVGVRLHPRTGSSPSDGRSSQNGGATNRLAHSFHDVSHGANFEVSNLKRGTVGNSQWNPRFVKM